jgi:1-acyl-sn-glycerol-3-phosphate acyltransferase
VRGRRFLTLPGYLLAWSLCVGAAPLWLPLAALADALRRSGWVAVRLGALLTWFFSCELMGVGISAVLWLDRAVGGLDAEGWSDIHYRLEGWWANALFRAVVRLFGLRVVVEQDAADLGHGPYLLLLRHVSMGDTLLASVLVSRPTGMRFRFILKRELLWDPCLDIVGNRIPNVFVDRFAEDSAAEIGSMQELARGLGERDGVLIYPEGTRFTPAKRARVLARLERAGDAEALAYARSLEAVLPPRPGGTLGLLEAAPQADVVVCSHTGFEGAGSFLDLWNGALLHRTVRVQFRRIPRAEIPPDREGRIAWLREEWQRVDAWVAEHRSP